MASGKIMNSTIVRKFSTSMIRNQLVKAPAQVFGIEGRYATALYSAATKQKQLEQVEKELDHLNDVFKKDKAFSEFVLNPAIPKSLKEQAAKSAAAKLSLTSSSANLLALLAENGRLKNLPLIANSFKILMAAHRGDLSIEVTLAQELDSSTQQELESTLKKFAKKGESLKINYKIDPAITGGMIVSIGDKYVDMSTASKLKRYTNALKTL